MLESNQIKGELARFGSSGPCIVVSALTPYLVGFNTFPEYFYTLTTNRKIFSYVWVFPQEIFASLIVNYTIYKNDFSQKPFSNFYFAYHGVHYLFLPD